MLHPFYPIVPDADWVSRLVPLGVKTIQLRIKSAPPEQIESDIKVSLDLCRSRGCQLIVNDYWQSAIELGANYIHLGQEDLAAAELKAIRRAGIKLGISTHSHEELETALAANPDYIALGPIYETILKEMTWAPQGLDTIAEWKRKIEVPLVAIGGITPDRAPAIFAKGADSVAVVTDIVTHQNPEERVKQWLNISAIRS